MNHLKQHSLYAILLSVFFAVAGSSCVAPTASAQAIRANWRLKAPFSDYKTYEWVPSSHDNHQFYRQYVGEYVNYALTKKKGLQRVSASQSPDLIVKYHFLTQETVDTNTTYLGDGGGWGMGGWGMGGMGMGMGGTGFSTTSQQPRTIGILTLDFIDARTKQLVWRGQATEDNIVTGGKGEEKQVAMSIFKMLERYPPPAAK